MRTVKDVIAGLQSPNVNELAAPPYCPDDESSGNHIGLHIASMKNHCAPAGHELFWGLQHNGYTLCGKDLEVDMVDVHNILDFADPSVLVLQDKREWDGPRSGYRTADEGFQNVEALRDRHDIFKITVSKDSHQRPVYHKNSADEINAHAWIVYYHPEIVKHVAPYIRQEHMIRTSHSINPDMVPAMRHSERANCLISGAVSRHYPLRQRLIADHQLLGITYKRHPGYGAHGLKTPAYLAKLNKYKTTICTSSRYGYALRKIIEATCCGCKVITDLPTDDVLPEIDGNLTRIPQNISIEELKTLITSLSDSWSSSHQREIADRAKKYYDYREVTRRLADDIEALRMSYTFSEVS